LKPDETIHVLKEWTIRSNRVHRYFCISTVSSRDKHRFLIYNIRPKHPTQETYEPKLLWQNEHTSPIQAICPYKDTYLAVAFDNCLVVRVLDTQKKALLDVCSVTLRWPIQSISTDHDCLHVACARDGILVYRLVEDKLQFVTSDRYSLSKSTCLSVEGGGVITGDAQGNVVAYNPIGDAVEHVQHWLEPAFGTCVHEPISVLVPAKLHEHVPPASDWPCFVAATTGGSLVQFTPISQMAHTTMDAPRSPYSLATECNVVHNDAFIHPLT
jgi:hypothetical protein